MKYQGMTVREPKPGIEQDTILEYAKHQLEWGRWEPGTDVLPSCVLAGGGTPPSGHDRKGLFCSIWYDRQLVQIHWSNPSMDYRLVDVCGYSWKTIFAMLNGKTSPDAERKKKQRRDRQMLIRNAAKRKERA